MSEGPDLWTLPAAWRAVDFISDLHLSPAMPATALACRRLLRQTRADAVCILGDLFEAWVGDDARQLPFEAEVVDGLRRAGELRELLFMPGNRDFLVGADVCRDAGMRRLGDPTLLDAWGRRWLLSHGDALCLSDTAYQAFRAEVRTPQWQQRFLARPLVERIAIARQMRRASSEHRREVVEGLGDLDPEACRALLRRHGARTLVHGHTHRPADHDLGEGLSRIVLSDWDCDAAVPERAQVLRLSREGLARLSPDQACAGR